MLKKITAAVVLTLSLTFTPAAVAWDEVCMKLPIFHTWFAADFYVVYDFPATPGGRLPYYYYDTGRKSNYWLPPGVGDDKSLFAKGRIKFRQHCRRRQQVRLPRARGRRQALLRLCANPRFHRIRPLPPPTAPTPKSGTTRQTVPTGNSGINPPASPARPHANTRTKLNFAPPGSAGPESPAIPRNPAGARSQLKPPRPRPTPAGCGINSARKLSGLIPKPATFSG